MVGYRLYICRCQRSACNRLLSQSHTYLHRVHVACETHRSPDFACMCVTVLSWSCQGGLWIWKANHVRKRLLQCFGLPGWYNYIASTYVDLCFHASSLPCLHTFWHAIPTSFTFLFSCTILNIDAYRVLQNLCNKCKALKWPAVFG